MSAVDIMGYSTAWVERIFTAEEVAAARRLAAAANHQWDVVGEDPLVLGYRFLRSARICLRGDDPGEEPPPAEEPAG